MDEYQWAKRISDKFSTDFEDTLTMLREETEIVMGKGRKTAKNFQSALDIAGERLGHWIEAGQATSKTWLDPKSLAHIVAAYRRTFIWATLAGMARRGK